KQRQDHRLPGGLHGLRGSNVPAMSARRYAMAVACALASAGGAGADDPVADLDQSVGYDMEITSLQTPVTVRAQADGPGRTGAPRGGVRADRIQLELRVTHRTE